MDVRFFKTPPVFRYSKREEQFDTSTFVVERETYAELQVRRATKPGTR
jgi:hypothetical protein